MIMSTKWNNKQRLQKTPPVCKMSPPGLPQALREFPHWPLQAQADWHQQDSFQDISISGIATLAAEPTAQTHHGKITMPGHELRLLLQWFEIGQYFRYSISLFVGVGLWATRFIEFNDPTAALPFSAGLFSWGVPGDETIVHSKILS